MWHRDLLRLAALAALLAAAAAQPLTVLWVPGGGYASSHLGGDAGAVVHVRLDANYAVTGFDVGDITWPEYALNSTAAVSLASLDEGAGLQVWEATHAQARARRLTQRARARAPRSGS